MILLYILFIPIASTRILKFYNFLNEESNEGVFYVNEVTFKASWAWGLIAKGHNPVITELELSVPLSTPTCRKKRQAVDRDQSPMDNVLINAYMMKHL